ncbi:MAG: alpha/beta hydrolase [Clostridia bacterium]|nr:alpha/beta hydrolase [Clostridia bacterium]
MHFGFSYVGLLYLVMLFVPNILWTKHKPKDYDLYVGHENKLLLTLERIGEVLVSGLALVFSDFNLRPWNAWSLWLAVSFVLMVLYEIFWVRYFRSPKTMADFYSSLFKIPVAGATLPVAAFFLLGIYGCNFPMILSSVILGIGHIGIHLAHRKEVCGSKPKKHIALRILRTVGAVLLIAVFGIISAVIALRNARYVTHYPNLIHGVDEGIYLPLGGQEQYVLMTGRDTKNPVILYLHGGPSSPDAYVTYSFADRLTDQYTFVCWDQRGCGRTYFRNIDKDPDNADASFEQALTDLDELVDYLRNRFGQEKVILMGHSYGTILGSRYALAHPEKVSRYIAVAQVVSLEKSDLYSYRDALDKAKKVGDDTAALEAAYQTVTDNPSLVNLMALRREVSPYHPAAVADKSTWYAVTSPYFGMDDFRWFLRQLGDMDDYFALNRQLFDYTQNFDAEQDGMTYQMPVTFLSGSDDWICPVDSVKNYYDAITAPSKELRLIDGCGHSPQFSLPEAFAREVHSFGTVH